MRILFALLLLAAQQQALAHPLVHLHDGGPVQNEGDSGDPHPAVSACDFHAAFAQVLGGVDAVAPVFHRGRVVASPGDGFHIVKVFAFSIVPGSRGPPPAPLI